MRRGAARARAARLAVGLVAGCGATAPDLVPLNELLEGQVVDKTVLSQLGNFSVSFLGSLPIQCTDTSFQNLHVEKIDLDWQWGKGPGAPTGETILDLKLHGVGFDLSTTYLFYGSMGHLNLSTINNTAEIAMRIHFTSECGNTTNPELPCGTSLALVAPVNATVETCSIALGTPSDNFAVSADGGLDYLFSKENMLQEVKLACTTILPPMLSDLVGNASDLMRRSQIAPDPAADLARQEDEVEKLPSAGSMIRYGDSMVVEAVERIVGVLSPPGERTAVGAQALLDSTAWLRAPFDVSKWDLNGVNFPKALSMRPGLGLYGGSIGDVVNLTLAEVNVTGLDNITGISLDAHDSNFSLLVGLEMGRLGIDIGVDVRMLNPNNGAYYDNKIKVTVPALYGMRLNLTVLLAIDGDKIVQLTPQMVIESFKQMPDGGIIVPLLCLLWPVNKINITTLAIGLSDRTSTIDTVTPPVMVSGILPSGSGLPSELDTVVDTALQWVVKTYAGAMTMRALPRLTQEYLLPVALESDYWAQFMASVASHQSGEFPLNWACPVPGSWGWVPYVTPDLVDFSNNTEAKSVDWAINDLLAPVSAADVNKMAQAVVPPGELFTYSLALPGAQPGFSSLGTAGVTISDLALDGTLARTSLLHPRGKQAPQVLDNSVSGDGVFRVHVTVRLTLVGDIAPTPIDDTLRISAGVQNLAAAAALLLSLNATRLQEIPFNLMVDPHCVASALSGTKGFVRMPDDPPFTFNITSVLGDVVCPPGKCSSPDMHLLHDTMTDPANQECLNHYADVVGGYIKKYVPQMIRVYVTGSADGDTGDAMDQWVREMAPQCDVSGEPTPAPPAQNTAETDGPLTNAIVYAVLYGMSFVSLLVLMAVVAIAYLKEHRKDRDETRPLVGGSPTGPTGDSTLGAKPVMPAEDDDGGVSDVANIQRRDDGDAATQKSFATSFADRVKNSSFFTGTYRRAHDKSLAMHPAIPIGVRIGHPICIVVTIIIFLVSNTSTGAVIGADVHVAGSQLKIDDIFSYGLANTVRDFWNGGIYALSLLVGVLSGYWPYLKCSLLLFSWFCPPSYLPTQPQDRRGQLLRILDISGKWSLIDEFLMVMMISAFHVVLNSPEKWTFIPKEFVTIQVKVVPGLGMHFFLLAAILSLTLNHLQLVWHRNAMEADSGRDRGWFAVGAHDQEKTRLCSKVGTRRGVGLSCLLFVTAVILVLGTVLQSFAFEFKGVAGWALNYEGDAKTEYSVYSLAKGMIDQADSTAQSIMSYGWLMYAFLIFAVIVPFLQIVFLAAMWLWPLRLKYQKLFLFGNEILAAWSAIEVLIVSLMASLLQISQLATFILGTRVDTINKLIKEYAVPLKLMSSDEATLFDVKSQLLGGFWILLVACILVNICYRAAVIYSEEAIEAREKEIARNSKEGEDGEQPEWTPRP